MVLSEPYWVLCMQAEGGGEQMIDFPFSLSLSAMQRDTSTPFASPSWGSLGPQKKTEEFSDILQTAFDNPRPPPCLKKI